MSRLLSVLKIVGELMGSSARQLLGTAHPAHGSPTDLQSMAAAASQASSAFRAVEQLRNQDAALLKAARMPSAGLEQAKFAAISTQDGIQQMKALQQLLPVQRLQDLSRWALKEGLATLATGSGTGRSGTLVSDSMREADPFGILMALHTSHRLRPITAPDYLMAVQHMARVSPSLMSVQAAAGHAPTRPVALQSIMHFCHARRALISAWQLLSMQSEPHVAVALQACLRDMAYEAASMRRYSQALLAWHEAHLLMAARDTAQVDMRLMRVQLEARLGSNAGIAEVLQALNRAEQLWQSILHTANITTPPGSSAQHTPSLSKDSYLRTTQSAQAASTRATADSDPGRLPATASELERVCLQLQRDMQVVARTLTPHRNVSMELSMLLDEYQAGYEALERQ